MTISVFEAVVIEITGFLDSGHRANRRRTVVCMYKSIKGMSSAFCKRNLLSLSVCKGSRALKGSIVRFILCAMGSACLLMWWFKVGNPITTHFLGLSGAASFWLAIDRPFNRP